ncbi:hypothetical protein BSKO_13020 [Bryopsis sp. KO-2023]|nr:hypothetical protein BSKO_13020 [Bryopsis sp. KO-2023]
MSSEDYTIQVIDLPLDAKEEDLLWTFQQVGHIDRIRLYRDKESGRSLGRALVVYEFGAQPNPVEKALVELRHERINGQCVRITRYSPKPWGHEGGNLFVGFLGKDVDDMRLREMFEPFGALTFCKVETSPSGFRRCCGQVRFEERSAAEEALQIMNGWKDKNGKKLQVEWFVSSKQISASRIFVKHLPLSIENDYTLALLFEKFGEITETNLCCDELDVPRGFGFVTFRHPQGASAAISEMNKKWMENTRLLVERAHQTDRRRI